MTAWNLVAGWRGCKCVCSSGEGLCISNSISDSNSVKTARSKLRDYWAQGNTEFGQWSDHSELAECWVLVTALWLIASNQKSYRKYAQSNYKIFSFSICLNFLPPLLWRCFDRCTLFSDVDPGCEEEMVWLWHSASSWPSRWKANVLQLGDVWKPLARFISGVGWPFGWIYSVLLNSWKMHECYAVWDSDG